MKDDANIGVWESKAGITCSNRDETSDNNELTKTHWGQNTRKITLMRHSLIHTTKLNDAAPLTANFLKNPRSINS